MLSHGSGQPYSQVIKLAQYLTNLTVQQDIWTEVGKALKVFFEVDFCAIGEKKPDKEIIIRSYKNSAADSFAGWLNTEKSVQAEAEILELVADTLESGFLNTRIYTTPEPLSILFLPIVLENRTVAALIVGHRQAKPLPLELLDVYLAVAGLVGTTLTRLASEKELRSNRERLEEQVKQRTAELARTNQRLKHEIGERKRTEAILAVRLRLMIFSRTHTLEELLRTTLDEAENLTGSQIGFYDFVAPDQATLTMQCWSNRTTETMCQVQEINRHYSIELVGVWADCVRERRAIMYNDFETLPNTQGLPAGHALLQRRLVVPVLRGDLIVAILGVGNKVVDYGPEDIRTISVLADLAWDIVETKRAEEALRMAHAELEERVQLRTAELRASNLALKKALRAKDEFMATMSHELRTPLTGVLGLSQVLQMPAYGPLSEKQLNAVINIEKSGQRLLNLINDVLDFSMLQSRSVSPHMRPCSLTALCQNAIKAISSQSAKKHQTARLSIHPEQIILFTDERLLNQVLSSLLHNASKFTPLSGEFGIEVTGDEAGRKIAISVWDTGIGIDEQDFPRLFQPFVQLDASLTRRFEGTGLGLALVKLNAELLGGSVTVTSQLGRGSRFTIILPWKEIHEDQPVVS